MTLKRPTGSEDVDMGRPSVLAQWTCLAMLALAACSSSTSDGSSGDDGTAGTGGREGTAGTGGRDGTGGSGGGTIGCRNDAPVPVRALSLAGAPTPDGAMLGTVGREPVLLSWRDEARKASAYDPSADTWRTIELPTGSPVITSPRFLPYLGVAQGRVFMFGGRSSSLATGTLRTGATLELGKTSWRETAAADAPLLEPAEARGQWVFELGGKTLVVASLNAYGGQAGADAAALYDAAANTWTRFGAAATNYACGPTSPVAGPSSVACAGGGRVFLVSPSGVRALPAPPRVEPATVISLGWVGERLFLVGVTPRVVPGGEPTTPSVSAAIFDPARDAFVEAPAPPMRADSIALHTVGGRLVALGNLSPGANPFDPRSLATYDEGSARWSEARCLQVPVGSVGTTFVSGDELFLLGYDDQSRPAFVALRP